MKRMQWIGTAAAAVILLGSCAGQGGKDSAARSMEQLYAEQGRPVRTRVLEEEDFSVALKFPAVLHARSESTAYAGLNDVVRTVQVRVGDYVRKDQEVLSLSADNPALTQATLAWENAKAAYERSTVLYEMEGISRQDFEKIQMQYEMASASRMSARDMVHVKAPIDGYITQINVRPTENVNPGKALFTVSNRNSFEARFYAGISEVSRIATGSRVFIDGCGGIVEGRVSEVSLMMDSSRKAFPVTAVFDGGCEGLVSGMGIDLSVETYRNGTALVLSRKELVKTASGYGAYIAGGTSDRGQAMLVPVTTGEERGLDMEITGGLKAGDVIITEGIQGLSDGVLIKPVMSVLAMNTPGGEK